MIHIGERVLIHTGGGVLVHIGGRGADTHRRKGVDTHKRWGVDTHSSRDKSQAVRLSEGGHIIKKRADVVQFHIKFLENAAKESRSLVLGRWG